MLTVVPKTIPPTSLGLNPQSIHSLLPNKDDPDYLWVLCEMIRADLELNWSEGRKRTLLDYREEFPDLFSNPTILRSLANEEFHIRESHGDNPKLQEYSNDYGIDLLDSSPMLPLANSFFLNGTSLTQVKPVAQRPPENQISHSSNYKLRNSYYHVPLPDAPTPFPEQASGRFPNLQDHLLGFQIVEEIGRGSFGRVYLVKQESLANRTMVLKVTTKPTPEANRLAKLQHTNIVPVYSVHSLGTMQAICMPYLGRYTLQETLDAIRKQGLPHRSGSELFSTLVDAATVPDVAPNTITPSHATPSPISMPSPRQSAQTQPVRQKLEGMTYQDAVIWVIARLADGLDHAHTRGIRHHDIKPANILLSDDGQPMLLDFNLAHDISLGSRKQLGGTIMYMAPEQLEEVIANEVGSLDERTDLFSLGVIFFELLSGHHPFPVTPECKNKIASSIALRKAGAPNVRTFNPQVPLSVAAVIEKLLQFEPSRRYQTGEALRNDLDRHAQNLPLLCVKEPSFIERTRKWFARNPQASRHLAIAALSTLTVGVAAWGYQSNQAYHTRMATETVRSLHNDLATLRVDLATSKDPADIASSVSKAKSWLNSFAMPQDDVAKHPTLRKLSVTDRTHAMTDLGELAALLSLSSTEDTTAWQAKAEKYTAGAEDWQTRNQFCTAIKLYKEGRIADAMKQLDAVALAMPEHFGAQFLLALCRADLQQPERAIERIEIARSLAPQDSRPSFHAGRVYFEIKRYPEAEAAFTRAIDQNPTSPEAYIQRARVRYKQGQFELAMKDLTTAAALGGTPPSLLALRYRLHNELNHPVEAEQDRQALIKYPARTAYDHYLKGYALVADQPELALEAFQQATKMNPYYKEAWHNQAHVYFKLNQKDNAVVALTKAIEACPDFADSRIARGLVQAQLGRREDAHKDAEAGLMLPVTPRNKYQAACVYAVTSRENPQDAERAYSLLRECIRDGYNSVRSLEEDKDWDGLRETEQFKTILAAMREVAR